MGASSAVTNGFILNLRQRLGNDRQSCGDLGIDRNEALPEPRVFAYGLSRTCVSDGVDTFSANSRVMCMA